jgi:hypothetical protein
MQFLIIAIVLFVPVGLFIKRQKQKINDQKDHSWYEETKLKLQQEPEKVIKVILKDDQEINVILKPSITSLYCGEGYYLKTAKEHIGEWISNFHKEGSFLHNEKTINIEDVIAYKIA